MKIEVGSIIFVDHDPRKVIKIKPSHHGWYEVFLDSREMPGVPCSRHLISKWFVESSTHGVIMSTGGHRYSKRAGTR